ncbi:MAG: HAMP domain-containing protein [Deltaproteobacteria bacterium]|nr:HAMP domain-containing protein [Deltaproteobacteria bacterium]
MKATRPRWVRTVAGKTALGIALPLLAVVVGFGAYGIALRRDQTYRQIERDHAHHVEMLVELLRESAGGGRGHDLAGIVAAVRRAERYSEVVIADRRALVRHAGHRALVGKPLRSRWPDLLLGRAGEDAALPLAPRTARAAGAGSGRTDVIRTVAPLRNDPQCHRCHGAREPLNGVVVFEAPTTEIDARFAGDLWGTAVKALALLLAATGAVYAAQHRLVVGPLGRLTAAARAVEAGKGSRLAVEAGGAGDEVGQLSAAFRRMVERLAEAHVDLERRIQARTAELAAMGEELKLLYTKLMHVERLTTMGELAATIAHEVRTPLNALAINLQLLKRELRAPPGPAPASPPAGRAQSRDTVAMLEAEVARINAVVEEFVRYARLPRPSPRPLELGHLCRGTVHLLETEARRSAVQLRFDAPARPLPVLGDEDQLRQVLINLLLNAIQAMPAGGRLALRADEVDRDARLAVSDTGPGIAQEVSAVLFRPFVTTKPNGTGLGLAIATRIIGEHHGRISARNLPEGGACFEIRLPLEAARPASAGRGAPGDNARVGPELRDTPG